MKLLLLEDEDRARAHLTRVLAAAGHTVDGCGSGQDAIFLAMSNAYDVLILDRMVSGVDGLSALKALRAAGVRSPALFLTAMTGVDDRVGGLEAGADDYLSKPFAVSELVARVTALGRRPPLSEAAATLVAADLVLDRLKRSITRAGRPITLQAQEFKLLEYLMLHAGEVVTRSMLLEHVWSFHFDTQTNVVESHVSRLRAKVDRGFDRELIHTVRGVGYRLDAQ